MGCSRRDRYRDTFRKKSIPVASNNPTYAERVTPELTLRTKTNSGARIFRLPAEITANVFKLSQIHDSGDSSVKAGEWCWLNITHVCKLWREIAIGAQDLWTYLDIQELSGTEQTAAYLARSGTSELVVHFDSVEEHSFECLLLVLAQIHRIRELFLWDLSGLYPVNRLLPAVSRSAPALQELIFNCYDLDFDLRRLFRGEAPNLRDLAIYANSPSWTNISIMRNLEYLSINTSAYDLDLWTAVSILLENPNMKELSMSSLKSDPRDRDSRAVPGSIRLPFLTKLDITADYDIISQFFERIITPSLTDWAITVTTYPVDMDPDANPKGIFPRVYARKECNSLKLILSPLFVKLIENEPIKGRKEWDGDDCARRELTYSRDVDEDEEEVFTISVIHELDHLCSVLEGGNWCSAKSLTIEICSLEDDTLSLFEAEDLGSYPWARLLMLFPALQELTVRRFNKPCLFSVKDSHQGLLEALQYTFIDTGGRTHSMCSQLKYLRITGMDLYDGFIYLVESLKRRAELGNRLCKLTLDDALGISAIALRTFDQKELVEEIQFQSVPLD